MHGARLPGRDEDTLGRLKVGPSNVTDSSEDRAHNMQSRDPRERGTDVVSTSEHTAMPWSFQVPLKPSQERIDAESKEEARQRTALEHTRQDKEEEPVGARDAKKGGVEQVYAPDKSNDARGDPVGNEDVKDPPVVHAGESSSKGPKRDDNRRVVSKPTACHEREPKHRGRQRWRQADAPERNRAERSRRIQQAGA